MNLFAQHITSDGTPVLLSNLNDNAFLNIPQERLLIRKKRWIDFFEEHRTGSLGFCTLSLEALDEVFEVNSIIQTQTEMEVDFSFHFYLQLINTREYRYFNDKLTAKKFLVLSLIYSKYYCFFNASIRVQFNALEQQIGVQAINALFRSFLVKFDSPEFVLQNFENLDPVELHLFVHGLTGKNLKKHELFQGRLSNSGFSQLMNLHAIERYNDNIIIRAAIYVLMLKVDSNEELTISFIRASKIFHHSPQKYFRDIDFWRKGLQLISELVNHPEFNLIDVVDYLDYMRYMSLQEYSLKGRTAQSLLRATNAWHGRVYKENHNHLRKLEWKANKEKFDLHFDFRDDTYRCIQLINGEQLYQEGHELEHCVITYAYSCANYICRIWSMQINRKGVFKRLMTIEETNGTIVQARKKDNALPDEYELSLLQDWAERMEFTINLEKND